MMVLNSHQKSFYFAFNSEQYNISGVLRNKMLSRDRRNMDGSQE